MKIFNTLSQRLKEPSSMAALAALAAIAYPQVPPGAIQQGVLAASVLAGLAGVLLGEK